MFVREDDFNASLFNSIQVVDYIRNALNHSMNINVEAFHIDNKAIREKKIRTCKVTAPKMYCIYFVDCIICSISSPFDKIDIPKV